MQIMVAEYASQVMPKHAEEGIAMRDALCAGFHACGHVVRTPDRRATDDIAFEEEVVRVAQTCDAGIVVAPDHVLSKLTTLVEANTLNLGCPPGAIRRATDKLTSTRLLREQSIRVPRINPTTGPYVLKPRCGCGADRIRITNQVHRGDLAEDTFVSKFITGEHISVSLIIGQTVLPLSINKQLISIGERVRYHGNMTPYPIQDPIGVLRHVTKAARVLGCRGYVGIDVVLEPDGRGTVVEVNARPTTAIVGINRVVGNVAELMLKAKLGHKLPSFLAPRGRHTFLKRHVLHGDSDV